MTAVAIQPQVALPTLPSVGLLGEFRVVTTDGVVTKFPTRRCALLLIKLALQLGASITREDLCKLLWPDETVEVSKSLLRNEIARLKKVLGGAPGYLNVTRSTVNLIPNQVATDLQTIELFANRADVEDPKDYRALADAVRDSSQPLVPAYNEEWIGPWRTRAQEIHRQLTFLHARSACLHAPYEEAQEAVIQALSLDSTNEQVVRSGINRALREEKHVEALRLYENYRQVLSTEFGAQPSIELRRLMAKSRQTQAAETDQVFADDEAPPSNILAPIQPLVGRKDVLKRLESLLTPSAVEGKRLITLLGVGGIGKTRLSQEVTHRLKDSFSNRVWFFDLAGLTEGNEILAYCLDRLQVERTGSSNLIHFFELMVGAKDALIVLDNFEQINADGAEVVRSLLATIPSLRILVTSRRRLGILGEFEIALSGLDTTESVELYLHSSPQTEPDEYVAELVNLLEGIPLAINLAASYGAVLTPKESLEQMKSRFDFLVSPVPVVPARHQTLWSTIEWGYQLLDAETQAAFAQLAVFEDGCDLVAVSEVLGITDAHRVLERLVSSSFIFTARTVHGIRFRLLEALREFASSKLSPSSFAELRERHYRYFSNQLEVHCSSPRFSVYELGIPFLERDYKNIELAFEWALRNYEQSAVQMVHRIYQYWIRRGKGIEGLTWMRRALAGRVEPNIHALGVCHGAGQLALSLGLINEARDYFNRSAQIGVEIHDDLHRHIVLGRLCEVERVDGNYQLAIQLGTECLNFFNSPEDAFHRTHVLADLALTFGMIGQIEQAIEAARDIQEFRKNLPHRLLRADGFATYAAVCFEQGDLGSAQRLLLESNGLIKPEEFPLAFARSLELQILIHLDLEDLPSARQRFDEFEKLLRSLGSEWDNQRIELLRAKILLKSGSYVEARQAIVGAGLIEVERPVPVTLQLLDCLALALWRTGQQELAGEVLAETEGLRVRLDVPRSPSEGRFFASGGSPTSESLPISDSAVTPEEALLRWCRA